MTVFAGTHRGMDAVFIENDRVRAAVLPALGAKIASLVYKPREFEVFFQPSAGRYERPSYGADFARFDTSGADDMFPTIDPCVHPAGPLAGKRLPDHGELWSIPWEVTPGEDSIDCRASGLRLPYLFERRVTLRGPAVRLDYRITSTGERAFHALWAFHGLVACDEETRLFLPRGSARVVNVHADGDLGPAGTRHAFPTTAGTDGRPVRLDRVGPASDARTRKLYVDGKIAEGEASLTLDRGRLLYRLIFPREQVPYLGVWVNEGGFKGEHNCALEPSTGFYDSVEKAHAQGAAPLFAPGTSARFFLGIELSKFGG